jgi:exopolysaccharide biosynthesis protein
MFKRSVRRQTISLRNIFVVLCLGISACARAQQPTNLSTPPVTYEHIVRHDPNYSLHVMRINLKDPRVSIRVSRGGPDPDGDGPWLTTLLPTSEIAERDKYDVAINGDFFDAQSTKDIEGKNTGYIRGKAAAPVGMAMTDGVLWHRPENARPYLEITTAKIAKLTETDPADPIDTNAVEIVGGGQIIERDGRAIPFASSFATNRHPRTVVGIDATGTQLTFLVVDGRQPKLSIGMTLAELSHEMIQLGCTAAINLDGGGSTTLVYRDPQTKKLAIMNSPSDSKERSVADVLGVTINAK